MLIPNDTGYPWRLEKFIQYQHAVPPVDPSTLLAYTQKERLSAADAVLLAFLHSAVYCEVTAIFLFETLDWKQITSAQLEKFWKEHKPNLLFNSSRRYAKNMNWFVPIIEDGLNRSKRDWLGWVAKFPDYSDLRNEIESVVYTGHFAGGRFLEVLLWFSTAGAVPFRLKEPAQLPWSQSANETSGLLNILYADEEADEFDRSGKLAFPLEKLDNAYLELHSEIFQRYPKQVRLRCAAQGKLCSWRNLFKKRRYAGFHHDRQLENIRKYEAAYPKSAELWARLYRLRKSIYAPELLGEIGGWTGIRKERQKLWREEGRTGAEK